MILRLFLPFLLVSSLSNYLISLEDTLKSPTYQLLLFVFHLIFVTVFFAKLILIIDNFRFLRQFIEFKYCKLTFWSPSYPTYLFQKWSAFIFIIYHTLYFICAFVNSKLFCKNLKIDPIYEFSKILCHLWVVLPDTLVCKQPKLCFYICVTKYSTPPNKKLASIFEPHQGPFLH